MNSTSEYLRASAESAGSSARQGEHHEAQTLTTATFSPANLYCVPRSVIPEICGALMRSLFLIKVTAPSPEIKLSSA